jgi:hypothetical protein
MKLTTINGMQIYGFRFHSLEVATRFAYEASKPQRIILGDHPEFWVVRPVDAERLVRAGYEYAN